MPNKGSDIESQARERREKQQKERLAREQQQQQELRDRPPVPTPELVVTPSTLIEPSIVPFESSTPSSTPPE